MNAEESPRAAVLGAGSWGTTYAAVLAEAGCQVRLWSRRAEHAAAINDQHENREYLAGVKLPPTLLATHEIDVALSGASMVALAMPAQTVRQNLATWRDSIDSRACVVSLAKGIELDTCLRMSEVIHEVAQVPPERIAVVSGPNLAREVARHQPAATVIACVDHARAQWLQRSSATSYFRPYTNTDVVGCELGGAVKNVIALACGMAEGMGLGDNSKASLITRGLAETMRLGVRLGADIHTFSGLAGLGDLVATCTSPLSRNRRFGELLARGETLLQAKAHTKQIAEGVFSCVAIRALAHRVGIEMPITEQVARVCHDNISPAEALDELMARAFRPESIN